MLRLSITDDGSIVDLGEVDVRTIERSYEMFRLKNNAHSGVDSMRHTRGVVCIWDVKSNLEGVQIWDDWSFISWIIAWVGFLYD